MRNEHDIMTYYQSALRTIGQYMLVSLGLLGYSRFYRKQKNDVYNIAFIALSLLILIIDACICFFLIKDLSRYTSALDDKTLHVDKWLAIAKIILVANICIATFGIFTLIRECRKR